nr:ArdC-like ssDNA-binding domain-containing protein [uncultured Draconibacterium sp.]
MSKDKKTARREQFLQKRKQLIAQSQVIRALIEAGEYDTVNEGLIETYIEANPGAEEFNTFNQWKEKGYTIVKGSTAFVVWGQPRKAQQTPEGSDEPEEYKYWPLCYLFSNEQVFKKGTTPEAVQEPKQQHQMQPVANFDELLN